MPLFKTKERSLLENFSKIGFGNPFLAEWIELEKAALGPHYVEEPPYWSMEVDNPDRRRPNTGRMIAKIERVFGDIPRRLASGDQPHRSELVLYEDATLFMLYHYFHDRLHKAAFSGLNVKAGVVKIDFYKDFVQAWNQKMLWNGEALPSGHEPQHTFACFFQIARAFHHIFENILGGSPPAARLRAAVWQSIFTHNIRRYRRAFYNRMGDFATLITGPSGTGKELVARAIALSRYIPYDVASQSFGQDLAASFHPIHIGALTSTLVESELFGHRRGAFTGADKDRRGWLETCPPLGAVFLDELGELTTDVQMKLLRVIETRTFTPVGETAPRTFTGKLIAATNRKLAESIEQGSFREDLYYRLCSDLITTPSLAQQIAESPEVLRDLVRFMARRNAADEGDTLGEEAYTWIEKNLGLGYSWPGNYRELEQCVRNVIIRQEYRPARSEPRLPTKSNIFDEALVGRLTADEMLNRYCTLVYARTGSYEEAARQLQIDRRTVKSRVDPELLRRLRSEAV